MHACAGLIASDPKVVISRAFFFLLHNHYCLSASEPEHSEWSCELSRCVYRGGGGGGGGGVHDDRDFGASLHCVGCCVLVGVRRYRWVDWRG